MADPAMLAFLQAWANPYRAVSVWSWIQDTCHCDRCAYVFQTVRPAGMVLIQCPQCGNWIDVRK